MYERLWRVLPGPTWVKAVESVVLFVALVALLFLFVFPWLSSHLPIDRVTVTRPSPVSNTVTPTSSADVGIGT